MTILNKEFVAVALAALAVTCAAPASAAPKDAACADRMYAVNSYSNNLSVVDTASNRVVDTVPVGKSPAWAIFTPDDKQLYVANNGEASLSVVDVATNRVVRQIATAGQPIGLAFTPDFTRLAVSFTTGTIQIIDVASGRAGAPIAVGLDPEIIGITPDGKYIYAVSAEQGVYKIDIAEGRVVATIPVARPHGELLPYPYNLLISPDGRRVYVANVFGGFVSVIDTATDKVVGTFDAPGVVGMQLNKDHTSMYVTNYWRASVDEYSVDSGRLLRSSGPTGIDLPSHLMLGRDGRYLYFGQSFGPKLQVFDTAAWKPVTTLDVGLGPNDVVVCDSASPR